MAVARQYCGTLGKVANCQVAVTAALWTGVRAWMLGAALYLPEEWLTPEARQRARIPATVRFQEKWRLALTLLRQIRAAGFDVTAVLGDAEFGDNATLRRTLHRLQAAVCARHLVDADRVSRHAAGRGAAAEAGTQPSALAPATHRRQPPRSGPGDRRRAAAAAPGAA